MFFFHLRPGFLSCFFFQFSPPKLCVHLCSPAYVLYDALISSSVNWPQLQRLVRRTDQEAPRHKNSVQSHETSSFLGPNTFLSTLFSNTLSLTSTPNIRDKDSRQFKTTQNLILKFILLDS